MADMALEIMGDDGGQFAVLSASPDAANQNAWIGALGAALEDEKYASLELVDTVYGNDDADESYNQALALVDSHPDIELIMAPTTVGIAAAGKAMTDEGLCDQVKVSGSACRRRCPSTPRAAARRSALWSFVDLGYLTYYATRASPRARWRRPRARRSPPGAWASTRSSGIRPGMAACGSSWARSPSTPWTTSTSDRPRPGGWGRTASPPARVPAQEVRP